MFRAYVPWPHYTMTDKLALLLAPLYLMKLLVACVALHTRTNYAGRWFETAAYLVGSSKHISSHKHISGEGMHSKDTSVHSPQCTQCTEPVAFIPKP